MEYRIKNMRKEYAYVMLGSFFVMAAALFIKMPKLKEFMLYLGAAALVISLIAYILEGYYLTTVVTVEYDELVRVKYPIGERSFRISEIQNLHYGHSENEVSGGRGRWHNSMYERMYSLSLDIELLRDGQTSYVTLYDYKKQAGSNANFRDTFNKNIGLPITLIDQCIEEQTDLFRLYEYLQEKTNLPDYIKSDENK